MQLSIRYYYVIFAIITLILYSCAAEERADEIAFYVSPEGNDSWAGDSIDRPFATIQKARDAIREMKKKSPLTKPVTIYMRGGMYELTEPLVFTPEDSGTETCPITYKAYIEEKPVISGVVISSSHSFTRDRSVMLLLSIMMLVAPRVVGTTGCSPENTVGICVSMSMNCRASLMMASNCSW